MKIKKALKIAGVILLAVLLVISVGVNIYYMFTYDSYAYCKKRNRQRMGLCSYIFCLLECVVKFIRRKNNESYNCLLFP